MKDHFIPFLFFPLLLGVLLSLNACFFPGKSNQESLLLERQGQIDSFSIRYPGWADVDTSLTIKGEGIANLEGLRQITAIRGFLSLNGTSITSLSGLDSLESVGRYFDLHNNAELLSLEGLNHLRSVGNTLFINFHKKLKSLEGLDSLTRVEGLTLAYNSLLADLHGLEGLSEITGNLSIIGNEALISLSGLESLRLVKWNVILLSNPVLADLQGLSGLEEVGYSISITGNEALKDCTNPHICRMLAEQKGTLKLKNNAPGCNAHEEIKTVCEARQ